MLTTLIWSMNSLALSYNIQTFRLGKTVVKTFHFFKATKYKSVVKYVSILSVLRLSNCLTNKNLPKVSLRQSYKGIAVRVVAQAISSGCPPAIVTSNKCSEIV